MSDLDFEKARQAAFLGQDHDRFEAHLNAQHQSALADLQGEVDRLKGERAEDFDASLKAFTDAVVTEFVALGPRFTTGNVASATTLLRDVVTVTRAEAWRLRSPLIRQLDTVSRDYAALVEKVKLASEVAGNYANAPCFAELLGEVDEANPCHCPVCGLRAISRALSFPLPGADQ